MITGFDAAELGAKLHAYAEGMEGSRMRFTVDPSSMVAIQSECVGAAVPLLTGHGGGQQLAEVIHSYHQWGQPIAIGLIQADGLFQFWVEKDVLA